MYPKNIAWLIWKELHKLAGLGDCQETIAKNFPPCLNKVEIADKEAILGAIKNVLDNLCPTATEAIKILPADGPDEVVALARLILGLFDYLTLKKAGELFDFRQDQTALSLWFNTVFFDLIAEPFNFELPP